MKLQVKLLDIVNTFSIMRKDESLFIQFEIKLYEKDKVVTLVYDKNVLLNLLIEKLSNAFQFTINVNGEEFKYEMNGTTWYRIY